MYNIVDDVMISINPLYDMIRYQISLFVIIIFEIYIYNVNIQVRLFTRIYSMMMTCHLFTLRNLVLCFSGVRMFSIYLYFVRQGTSVDPWARIPKNFMEAEKIPFRLKRYLSTHICIFRSLKHTSCLSGWVISMLPGPGKIMRRTKWSASYQVPERSCWQQNDQHAARSRQDLAENKMISMLPGPGKILLRTKWSACCQVSARSCWHQNDQHAARSRQDLAENKMISMLPGPGKILLTTEWSACYHVPARSCWEQNDQHAARFQQDLAERN